MKFTELPRPFIVGVISDDDVSHCVRSMKLGEFDGADGFQLELQGFKGYPPTLKEIREVVSSTTKPVWVTNRRRPTSAESDEDRVNLMLKSVEAGAACLDMEMDTFDPWRLWQKERIERELTRLRGISINQSDLPRECSFDEEATRKQMEVIDKVHSMGGEVLLSAHLLIRTTTEGVLRVGEELVRRGADLVKIVVWNDSLYDLSDTLKANVALSERLKVPFKLMSQGEPSKIGRVVFPMFGSAWAFCQQDLRPGGFDYRPLISTEKYILQHVDWRPNWALHKRP
ncbi:MAG: type I 3-dehydroquinate dehydratase [Candidatus Bathyarchaeia archaeon]